ncbi:MAG: glycosyltransferase [Bacteroidota bacterium]
MKIAICTIGSRGDVQPFLVLGEYLNQNGHEVTVSSASMYETLASNYEVTYESFAGDYASIVDDEALKKEVGRNPFKVGKALKSKVYPILESSLETFCELATWADIVLYHPKTMLDGICESMQEKLMKAYVVPAFTPTRAFTNPILSFLPVPKFLNKLSFSFAGLVMNSFNALVKNFRKKHNIQQKKSLLNTPIIYGISPSLLERPKDYPKDAFFTGFWMKENLLGTLSEEVKSFIADDKRVLLLTFGSMPYKSDVDIKEFLNAITSNFDLKVLLVRGWGLKDANIPETDNILAVNSAPFDSLFPKVDFAIHHGGAGTTAIALKSGLPQMICPVLHPFGDQYFWGKQIEERGVGVAPVPLKQLSTKQLINSVEQLLVKDLTANANLLKREINEENGLSEAKKVIEEYYALQ